MTEQWTVGRVLSWTTERFEREGIDSARLEAQVLIASVLSCERILLYAKYEQPLASEERGRIRALITERLAGQPLAYLVGEKEFWSIRLQVDSRVLIPRGDTETLVESVLALKLPDKSRVLELGTGSGAVCISLAKELPHCEFVATDISSDALDVARGNAVRNQVDERVEYRQGDLYGVLGDGEKFNAIVANLPYIESAEIETLAKEVQAEPLLALDGGADGLKLIRRAVADGREFLEAGGRICLEHGNEQGHAVRDIFAKSGFNAETRADLAGQPRVTVGRQELT